MNNEIVNEICINKFNRYPDKVKRFELGYSSYVYKIQFDKDTFILRITTDLNDYNDTVYWLNMLESLEIVSPKVIYRGEHKNFSYLILSYIDGDDLGNVYASLTDDEKREIAKELVGIQNKVSTLPQNIGYGYLKSYEDKNFKKSWKEVLLEHLNRSRKRIIDNKIFDVTKVNKVEKLLEKYNDYFDSVKPIPFLDDLSSKNVLIKDGKLSGIIDIDWICFGDKLYYIALTNMALMSFGYDTKYINFLMSETQRLNIEREILNLYTLIFCVDFMSEQGMKFKDEIVKASEELIMKLNNIFEEIYNKLII